MNIKKSSITASKERASRIEKGTIALMPPSVSLRSPPTPSVGVGKKRMDAPFRLAPLATHPLSGGGQEKHGGEGRLTQTLASPRSRGEGDHEVVEGGLKAVDACEAGIRTLSKERVPSNIKGQVNQTTHLAGRQPAVSCPIQLFQHIPPF